MAKMKLIPTYRNPKPFDAAKFQSQVRQLNPNDMAEVASHWKGKVHQLKNELQVQTQNAMEIAITGGTAGVLGYFSGGWQFEYDKTVAEWRTGKWQDFAAQGATGAAGENPYDYLDEDDPRELVGIPLTLWATVVLGAAAVLNVGDKKYNPLVRASALGAMATWASQATAAMGYESAADDASTAAAA